MGYKPWPGERDEKRVGKTAEKRELVDNRYAKPRLVDLAEFRMLVAVGLTLLVVWLVFEFAK